MYLSKKTYVKRWEHQDVNDTFDVTVKKGGKEFTNIKPERVSYIHEEIMYWRKANQIHGWFVENTEEINNHTIYYVTYQDLKNLVETCKTVLEALEKSPKTKVSVEAGWRNGEKYYEDVEVYELDKNAMSLLPPVEGFFFGSYVIDEWYKHQIEETIKVLGKEVEEGNEGDEYEYVASW